MTDIAISKLALGDAEIVALIHASCFDEAWDAATIRKVLAMPGAFGFAARADPAGDDAAGDDAAGDDAAGDDAAGDIVGFALARFVANECELLSLGVVPNRRGRGIGGGLLDASVVRAYALNATTFHLEVAEDNADALRLYEARGLVSVGRQPEYYRLENGQRVAALTMRCDLPTRESLAD